MAENFKKNIGTLGNEEVPSYYKKYIRQKLAKEHFQTSNLQNLIRTSSQQFSAEPSKRQFYVSGGPFCYKKFHEIFSGNERTIFGYCTENFRQGGQNCILRVQRNILGEKCFFFWEKLENENFRILSKTFSDFQQKSFIGIVKNEFYESIRTFSVFLFKKSDYVHS